MQCLKLQIWQMRKVVLRHFLKSAHMLGSFLLTAIEMMLELDRLLYATKRSKVTKNCIMFASNRLGRPTSTTNCAFALAMPIKHTYQCPMHVLIPLHMLDLKLGKGRRVIKFMCMHTKHNTAFNLPRARG